MIRYIPDPVIGYSEGIIQADESPQREREPHTDHPDNRLRDVVNDWFYVENRRYNVHPFRSDLGGYPVRWYETVI